MKCNELVSEKKEQSASQVTLKEFHTRLQITELEQPDGPLNSQ